MKKSTLLIQTSRYNDISASKRLRELPSGVMCDGYRNSVKTQNLSYKQSLLLSQIKEATQIGKQSQRPGWKALCELIKIK